MLSWTTNLDLLILNIQIGSSENSEVNPRLIFPVCERDNNPSLIKEVSIEESRFAGV